MALELEQAETLEDLMRRRLELEFLPGHGLELLPKILPLLKAKRPSLDMEKEENAYRERLSKLGALLK